MLDDLKGQGVAFQSPTEAIDNTETPTSRAMRQMVGILAELERSLIQERTTVGRAAVVARGVKMGRKRPFPQQAVNARELIELGEGRNPALRLTEPIQLCTQCVHN